MEDNQVEDQQQEIRDEGPNPDEQRARANGWRPKEEYKGDPSKWRDYDEFNEYGDRVTPILQKQRDEWQRKYQDLEKKFEGVTKTAQEITKRQMDKERKDWQAQLDFVTQQLKQARRAGNNDLIDVLEDERDKLQSSKPEEYKAPDPEPQQPQIDPAYTAWAEDNRWIEDDKQLGEYALFVGQRLRQRGDRRTGTAFYDAVKDEVKEQFPEKFRTRRTTVESPSSGASSRKNGTSYANLDSVAKAECDRFVKEELGSREDYLKMYNELA